MDIFKDVRCQRLMYIYGIKKMVLFINGASISNGSCAQKMHQLKVPGHLSIRDVKHNPGPLEYQPLYCSTTYLKRLMVGS